MWFQMFGPEVGFDVVFECFLSFLLNGEKMITISCVYKKFEGRKVALFSSENISLRVAA